MGQQPHCARTHLRSALAQHLARAALGGDEPLDEDEAAHLVRVRVRVRGVIR